MERVCNEIKKFNEDRLSQMVELKYKAMAENLYRFYRGTNHLFYWDLNKKGKLPPSPLAWICGDLHLENFGSFKSENRMVYFDLNDFDEAVLAPVTYELVRLITSIFIAFESLQIEQKKALNMAQLFLRNYSSILAEGKPTYIESRTANGIVYNFLSAVNNRKSKDLLKKRAVANGKELQLLLDDSRHLPLTKELKKELFVHITEWLKNDGNSPYNYKMIDAAFRLAGTGSIGLKRYVILLKTLNNNGEKYLLVDMKQSVASSVKPLKVSQPSWPNEAERIISIQKRMQNRAPALLSATVFKSECYVIQEMQPTRDSINFKLLKNEYRSMCQVIADMAMLTASAQLRSTGRQGSAIADELIVFGKNKNWQDPLLDYAIHYAHQVKTDYIHFLKDYKKGEFKIKAVSKKIRQKPKN